VTLVILDTQDIVDRYMQYDSLFSFYGDGVRDLVRDAVLWSGERKPQILELRDMEIHWMNSLTGQVTREWEYAIDSALEPNPEAVQKYQAFQQRIDHSLIEMVVKQVEGDVDRLIQALGIGRSYDIRDTSFGWIGNDLIVRIGPRSGDDE
jgi:hypothetical protein